ncbi:MAG: NADH-quinone oxidoreductase subunit C [Trueperaceae bacterium]
MVALKSTDTPPGAAVPTGGQTGAAAALEAMGARRHEFKGMLSYTVAPDRLVDALNEVKSSGFELLSDIFGIDWLTYPGHRGQRFTVAYNLYNLAAVERIFVRTEVADGEKLPTATGLWRAANFMEREVFDMFGVVFDGHPEMRKLLTPEDLDGHPHRKDFPIGETPTLFNDGRYLDPAAFRASIIGSDSGLTGWKGGARKGVRSEQELELVAHEVTGQSGGGE